MALPFVWGDNGQKISGPEQAQRARVIAQALQNRPAADSWQSGLANVTNGLAGMAQERNIAEQEAAGRERAGGLFADLAVNQDPNAIIAALTSPDAAWASPAQTDIASALLNSGLERADPMNQIALETAQLELDALRNPGPTNPYMNVGGGSVFNQQTGEFMSAPINGNGLSITTPDGTVVQQGGPAVKLTEGQGKDVVYYTRGLDANQALQTLDTELTDYGQEYAGKAPMGLGNYFRDPAFRQAKVAADSFLTSILRKDTGAAITDQEFDIYGPIFLPIPGDDPATIQTKKRMRDVALLAIRGGLGTADAVAQANAAILGIDPNQPIAPAGAAAPAPSGYKVLSVEPQ